MEDNRSVIDHWMKEFWQIFWEAPKSPAPTKVSPAENKTPEAPIYLPPLKRGGLFATPPPDQILIEQVSWPPATQPPHADKEIQKADHHQSTKKNGHKARTNRRSTKLTRRFQLASMQTATPHEPLQQIPEYSSPCMQSQGLQPSNDAGSGVQLSHNCRPTAQPKRSTRQNYSRSGQRRPYQRCGDI